MNPYALIAAVLLWLVSLAGVGLWQSEAGHTAERSAWQARDNTELADANSKILNLERQARDTEQRHAASVAAIADNYQKELTNEKAKSDAVIADMRAGNIRLRDQYASGVQAGGCGASQVAADPGGSDGEKGRELSREASEFLYSLAGEADEVARQLKACQSVLESDRTR